MRIASRTELGYVRTRNEDTEIVHVFTDEPGDTPGGPRCLVGVADGMGGHPAGDVASKVAAQTIGAAVEHASADPDSWLVQMLQAAHDAILAAAAAEPAYAGMGTTAALAFVTPDRAHVAHVGDSRVYLIRSGVAQQLTHDHNQRGYLTQALGIPAPIEPESLVVALRPADRLMLCTDGLSGLVDEARIGELAGPPSLENACD